ncbi:methyltransferase domain-containing protein [Bartonella sp. AP19HLJMH]|uniref:class I SAM-dependent methyltransferase n=1 Tax=Bartonella sp. AP19HLJMH TaxID=3243473 RepID=UPI0035CF6424
MNDLLVNITPEHYERYAIEGTSPWNAYLMERILEEASGVTSAKKKILDIGMGTGHMLFKLYRSQKLTDYFFYGVDIDPRMVQFCVKKCTELKYQHAFNIIEAIVSNLPFPGNSFSMIYARSVIHHWAEPKKGLQELCRVLDRGGRIIIHEPLADAEETALGVFNQSRRECGVAAMSTEEKFTLAGITDFLYGCDLSEMSWTVRRGEGLAALGCEIFIKKV